MDEKHQTLLTAPSGPDAGGTTVIPGAAEEPLFVNVTHMDRELYFEAVKSRGRDVRTVILTGGGVIVAVVGLLMSSITVAVLGAVIAVLALLSPVMNGKRDFRKLCELHPGGEWTKTVRFYRDRVETDSGTGRISSAPYSSIRRESESEHMYILEFGKELPATTFHKAGFVQGSVEELRPFLTEVRRRVYDASPEKEVDQQG